MDLFFNECPEFTKWVIAQGHLHEDFVVVDVGVQGGANPRWKFLGDRLVLHGFDAIKEEIDKLNTLPAKGPGRRSYHWSAIGERDGEQDFYFTPSQPTQSSFYQPGDSRVTDGKANFETRRVPVRSLDSLLASGEIPPADFFKVDVEGYENFVLAGAKRFLANRVLGVEAETSFNTSSVYPTTQIGNLQEALLPNGLLLYDLNFDRQPRASFTRGRIAAGMQPVPPDSIGRPATFNVLYCRDLIAESDGTQFYNPGRSPLGADTVIKAMIIFELHGLIDVAYDTASRFAELLGARFDVVEARRLLLRAGPTPGETGVGPMHISSPGAASELAAVYNSTSWKITAPLRALKRALS